MLSEKEVQLLKKRNYNKIKELIRISFGLGVNLTSPSKFKDSLRIINVILVVASLLSLYAHWSYTVRSIRDIPKIAESICTAFQTLISIIKMIYYLFIQRRLYHLLEKAQTHEFVRKIEIFHKGFPMSERLKDKIDEILESSWKNINAQLIFYICCCSAIISNYFFMALFVNFYNGWKGAPADYEPMMPFPSYYPIFKGKGLSFPYYHIQMFLGGSADYIAGMCAVSFDGVFIVLCVHAVGLVKVLVMLIENSTAPDVPKERRVEYLRYCIYQYQRVTEYIDELRRIYKHVSLSQFMLSLLVWGIVLFQMSVGLESDIMTLVRMLMYISAAGYEIVLYCYNGQRLTSECEKIPYAFFSCDWYNESEEFKQLLRMMIMRSGRSFYFQISWFTTMTLPTLMAMIKTSGSYFLLLRNVAE
ncbi:odorant receptor 63a [Haematobia irritans]|uniref:odorant receptor 63a n=1 Tax=Haematobia irritans TaxID=7368 RepID=UPI003F4F60A8